MATKAKKTEASIAEKLDALFNLQRIDSEIDRIKTIRGELPLEVQDLEDEIEGLTTRLEKLENELSDAETAIVNHKNTIKEATAAIIIPASILGLSFFKIQNALSKNNTLKGNNLIFLISL